VVRGGRHGEQYIRVPHVLAVVTGYEAIVYDLDGTLVDLDVDWNAVAVDVREVYTAANVDPPSDGLWDMLEVAADVGLADEVEAAIAAHEHDGARTSVRLAHADELLERSLPAGVCSLNCESERVGSRSTNTRARRRGRCRRRSRYGRHVETGSGTVACDGSSPRGRAGGGAIYR